MADNIAITPGTGATVATDDVGGVQYQRVKVNYGADGAAADVSAATPMPVQLGDGTTSASILAGDTGQNAQVISGARKEVAFSTTTAQAVAVTDVSNYRWVSAHITSQGTSSTVQFQASNDSTNWVTLNLMTTTSSAGPVVSSTTAANTMAHGPCPFRYFRLNVTGISAGTTAGIVEFFSVPMAFQGMGVDIFELPSPATIADTFTNPSVSHIGAEGMVYNGATWDRVRAANAAAGTTGTGVLAAGSLYFDGTNWQRAALSNPLPVRSPANTATLSNVAASATSVQLLAANASRKGAVIFNDSSAVLYVKFGTTASTTSFTYYVPASAHLELPSTTYTGGMDGIWASATGNARVTELT